MTKWVFAAIVFGLLATAFVVGSWSSLDTMDRVGVQLLASPSGRHGFTTSDRAGAMGFAAFICGLGCFGSIMAAIRSRSDVRKVGDAIDGSAWKCAGCGEDNPGSFQECWKCQRGRPVMYGDRS